MCEATGYEKQLMIKYGEMQICIYAKLDMCCDYNCAKMCVYGQILEIPSENRNNYWMD